LHAYLSLFFYFYVDHLDLHSFPTRRSSDLADTGLRQRTWMGAVHVVPADVQATFPGHDAAAGDLRRGRLARAVGAKQREDLSLRDRKSTRLNSSHLVISYAVFCLKKKKNKQ